VRVLQAYLANITYCDALIGRLLDALDSSPAARIRSSCYGRITDGTSGRSSIYTSSLCGSAPARLPFILVAPGVTREQTRTLRPVGFIDLFPTLIALCGLPPLADLDGISLVPLLKDPAREWDRPALTTHQQGNHALRSERWRYIRYADGGEELYDHANDLTNGQIWPAEPILRP